MEFKRLDEKKESFLQLCLSCLVVVLAAFCLATFVTTYVVKRVQVEGISMETTLMDKQYIWVRVTKNAQANDIVVFAYDAFGNGEEIELVKRVVALEGETVYSDGKKIYVKGVDGVVREPFAEKYAKDPTFELDIRLETVTVPKGHFYAMGDNINISRDSTEFGPVPISRIDGKVIM